MCARMEEASDPGVTDDGPRPPAALANFSSAGSAAEPSFDSAPPPVVPTEGRQGRGLPTSPAPSSVGRFRSSAEPTTKSQAPAPQPKPPARQIGPRADPSHYGTARPASPPPRPGRRARRSSLRPVSPAGGAPVDHTAARSSAARAPCVSPLIFCIPTCPVRAVDVAQESVVSVPPSASAHLAIPDLRCRRLLSQEDVAPPGPGARGADFIPIHSDIFCLLLLLPSWRLCS